MEDARATARSPIPPNYKPQRPSCIGKHAGPVDTDSRDSLGDFVAEQWPGGQIPAINSGMAARKAPGASSALYRCRLQNPCRKLSTLPFERLQAVIDEVWPALQTHAAYASVWRLHQELFDQVSQAEMKLLGKLRDIQNIYGVVHCF